MNRYSQYLKTLTEPHLNAVRLEFLNPDGGAAFALDGNQKSGYSSRYDSRAFIQGGSLSVSNQNGIRRKASITFANTDGAFDFAFNKLWTGNRVRLSMGVILPDGSEYLRPQGVFYLDAPSKTVSPSERQISYSLVDKWGYLDGSLFGKLEGSYSIPKTQNGAAVNVFEAMRDTLRLSRIDFSGTDDPSLMIDDTAPVFTSFYNGRTYPTPGGGYANATDLPYDIVTSPGNGTIASILLELNTIVGGMIGYDPAGALRVEPSQDDMNDFEKPVLWTFTPENSFLSGLTESAKIAEVYNDILVVGTGLTGYEVYGRATNTNAASETNIYRIGRRTYREEQAAYWNADQCQALAEHLLKQKTALCKSISISCPPIYHLQENALVSVKRSDREGAPVEKHLINSFSLPIAETGAMSINAVSVNELKSEEGSELRSQ